MVSTKTNEDDLPTVDAYGTDLVRVRTMLDLGYTEWLIGQSLGLNANRVRHAVIVATGDRQGAPTLEEIAERCREIQAGWTPEQAAQAKHGEARLSSPVVRDMQRFAAGQAARDAHHAEQLRRRVHEDPIPICELDCGDRRFAVTVKLDGQRARRNFKTREEAEEWGRAWLVAALERKQAETCCGR